MGESFSALATEISVKETNARTVGTIDGSGNAMAYRKAPIVQLVNTSRAALFLRYRVVPVLTKLSRRLRLLIPARWFIGFLFVSKPSHVMPPSLCPIDLILF
jgi:hypothetical protein